jgi:hypothetical protein
VRFEKSFELSPDGYDVAMSVRFSGPNVVSFLSGRQLQIEIAPGRGFYPAPSAGFRGHARACEPRRRERSGHSAVD